MNLGPRGEQEGEGGVGGNEGNGDVSDTKEKDVAWFFVSFSSEKETKEPWSPSPLSLGDAMIDPNLE